MAGGEDTPLANGFKGLNRAVAPYLLPPSESPDTTDTAPSTEIGGLLGPRLGNLKVTNKGYDILGVVPMNFPWARYRTIATSDGTWSNAATPWPAMITTYPNGWDVITFTLTTSQTGVGTTNSAAKTLSRSVDLSVYGDRILTSTFTTSHTLSASTSAVARLQGYIDSVWTNLLSVTYTSSSTCDVATTDHLAGISTGTLSQVRIQVEVTSGVGTLTAAFNDPIQLVYGRLYFSNAAS